MAIEVVTPAPSYGLTTKEAVKAVLGISGSDQDTLIDDMIKQASDFAISYCGRTFAKEEVRETLPGKGLPDIILSLTPILEMTTVKFRGGTNLTAPTNYKIKDAKIGILQMPQGWTSSEYAWNTISPHPSSYAADDWEFVYWGGYVLPGWNESDEGPRTLPYDLERAIIEMTKSYYLNRKTDGLTGNMKSYKIGDTSVTWDVSGSNSAAEGNSMAIAVPPSAVGVLNYYRRAF